MADAKLTALTETSVPALDDPVYSVDVSDTTDDAAGSSRKLTLQRVLGLLNHVCQGRLTTESGVPVSTTDRTSQSTIYFTPYNGNRVALYDGTRWILHTFTERSLALSGLTSGKNYDVFLYDNAGTLTLELSAAWTNDTTRADALTLQDGVYVKDGATTRRYLGTIRTTGTTTTEDSAGGTTTQVGGKRFVWNYYNRVRRPIAVKDTTSSWTYSTSDYRQSNGASGNRVEIVAGTADAMLALDAVQMANSTNAADFAATAIGEDSTTTPHALCFLYYARFGVASAVYPTTAKLRITAPLGYHAYNWLEWATTLGTVTWAGEVSSASDLIRRGGLTGNIEC